MLTATFACTGQVSSPGDGMGMGPASTTSPTPGATTSPNPGAGGNSSMLPGPGNVIPPAGQALPVDLGGKPIYSRFHRLTNDQYENSVRDIMKMTEPTGVTEGFLHAVSGTTDFTNNERVVIMNDTIWRDFQDAAETVAAKATATDQALQAVVATNNVDTFIKTLGRRAFRRDLTADEVTTYTALHTEGSMYSGTQSAFTKGAALVITAMLQSPHFLYRTEMADKGAPLSSFEMAAKLTLWLLDTTPSDAVLDAAKSGAFDSAEKAATQATTMLESAAAKATMRKFHNELYKFDLYDNISKTDVEGYTEALNAEFKESASLYFDRIFSNNLGVKEMLTTNVGFVGANMAKLYGMQATVPACRKSR
jgi:hypothetical protein